MSSSSSSSSPSSSPTTFYDAAFPFSSSKPRHTPSFSSSSSSCSLSSFRNEDSNNSNNNEADKYSPSATPVHYHPSSSTTGGGVPFSWEKLPGIPKKTLRSLKTAATGGGGDDSPKVLPLPPPLTPPAPRRSVLEDARRVRSSRFVVPRDPFFAALVECSGGFGDDEGYDRRGFLGGGSGAKVTRSVSERFGLIGSCKRSCAVAESLVYLPARSSPPYNLIGRRR